MDRLTIACVDTVSPAAGFRALKRSLDMLDGATGLFLTSAAEGLSDLRVVTKQIAAFPSITHYSDFILTHLVDHITTSHVLLVQWDGFALNATAWDEGFLEYDYIGAPWPQFAPPHNVGNGGFSLRSRRLLEALRDPGLRLHAPEDVCICRTNRTLLETRHGLRFAPQEVAARFAYERTHPDHLTFGFHGLFNFPKAMPQVYRKEIEALPAMLLTNRDAIDLSAILRHSAVPDDRVLARRIAARLALRRPGMLRMLAKAWLFE